MFKLPPTAEVTIAGTYIVIHSKSVFVFLFFIFPNRAKIFQDIERLIHPSDIMDKVVYDLDLQRSVVNSVTVYPNIIYYFIKIKVACKEKRKKK